MVFSDYKFIFLFLPITLLGFALVSRLGRRPAKLWLCGASLVFYAWWNPWSLIVLLISILFNFSVASLMMRRARTGKPARYLLPVAIVLNLGALVYYKYLLWLLTLLGMDSAFAHDIYLPIGISFFTFTQITFLIDVNEGFEGEYSFINYLLFVTFFPHLVAGPIVHHRDLMPQFEEAKNYRIQPREFAIGLTIFAFGLMKKTFFADNLAVAAERLLGAGGHGPVGSAWVGALSYSMQLYFDFSGYSDMAIGLARMFGILFPINFFSPYKATTIIDFWQRWHITLTRFLTAYVYNPVALGLVRRRARKGLSTSKRVSKTLPGFLELIAFPTLLTMFLAGVWHGAGGQFVVFGVLHGLYLSANHAWRTFAPSVELSGAARFVRELGYNLLVYIAVLVAQIFFQAHSIGEAWRVVVDLTGLQYAQPLVPDDSQMIAPKELVYLALAMLIARLAPSTMQMMADFNPAIPLGHNFATSRLRIRFSLGWALVVGVVLGIGLLYITNGAPFIYFQF